MPIFNYELSAQAQKIWDDAMGSGATACFACPVECDGFACSAQVEIWVREDKHRYEGEDDADDATSTFDRDFTGYAAIALSMRGSSAVVKIKCGQDWWWIHGKGEGLARELLGQAMGKAVTALSKTPQYREMIAAKELAHEMRVSIGADAAHPRQRSRGALEEDGDLA